MIRILTKNNYFWSNSQGVWHNTTLFWESNTLEFDDEPTFEILNDKYIAICDIAGMIYILEIDSQKKINTIDTKLEQIVGIVSSQNGDLLLTTGLQRDRHNAYVGEGFLSFYRIEETSKHRKYRLSGKYNTPLYLNEQKSFFLYSATDKDSAYHGKIYMYDYKFKDETIVLEDFCLTDYFNYNKKTNHIIIAQENKVSLFKIKQNMLTLDKYFFIEEENPIIVSINEFNDIFYIMLSDKIYTFNFETLKSKSLKNIDILMEPSIEAGSFSSECDFYVYIDDENNLISSEV
ncbi:MAG TPA: hypothetical protein ENK75_01515 [Saprospiraceae bacterium]|nr:hypothetical protein [Saprospiraceae bacterium]